MMVTAHSLANLGAVLANGGVKPWDNTVSYTHLDGSKLVTTTGRQYIELTQKPDLAFKFVVDSLEGKNEDK